MTTSQVLVWLRSSQDLLETFHCQTSASRHQAFHLDLDRDLVRPVHRLSHHRWWVYLWSRLKTLIWCRRCRTMTCRLDWWLRSSRSESLTVDCIIRLMTHDPETMPIYWYCTGWPNKNRTFFEIPYFCSQYRYNHAVFNVVFKNYIWKQQRQFF